jgi:hypothetical protein
MSQIIDEIRAAYSPWGIEIEGVTTYGTYYRLPWGRCGATVGLTGDHLLRGMAQEVVDLTRKAIRVRADGLQMRLPA